jgi:hypothetical protein
MSDKELLELAAKAAKYDYQIQKEVDPYSRRHEDNFYLRNHSIARTRDYEIYWNPLENDADAFRLAVKLHLIVGVYGSYTSVFQTSAPTPSEEVVCWHGSDNLDPYAATRRAILLAAAEIGRGME